MFYATQSNENVSAIQVLAEVRACGKIVKYGKVRRKPLLQSSHFYANSVVKVHIYTCCTVLSKKCLALSFNRQYNRVKYLQLTSKGLLLRKSLFIAYLFAFWAFI